MKYFICNTIVQNNRKTAHNIHHILGHSVRHIHMLNLDYRLLRKIRVFVVSVLKEKKYVKKKTRHIFKYCFFGDVYTGWPIKNVQNSNGVEL